MKISIVTVNFNGFEKTAALLESLNKQSDKNFDLYVVDNASEKSDFEKLKQYYTTNFDPTKGTFMIVENSKNLGFSGGNNAGIRHAIGWDWNEEADPVKSPQGGDNGASWVVLLNNDTEVESDFIAKIRPILASRGGIIGLVLGEDEKTARAGIIEWLKPTLKHIYSIKNYVYSMENLVLRNSKNKLKNNEYLIPDTQYSILNIKYYAIGGAMAIHKDVFKKIGLLDEKYFLYFEDADFSYRAGKAGIKIEFIEDIKVNHQPSSTTGKLGSGILLYYHYRNALYFNFKNGPLVIKLLVWPWSWIIIIKQVIKIILGIKRGESKKILKGVADFYKGKLGKYENSN